MNNEHNLALYRLYAPVYDRFMRRLSAAARRRSIEAARLQPGEHLLIPGVGTGLDLPYIPNNVHIIATDLSPDMLDRACTKAENSNISFAIYGCTIAGIP